MAERTKEDLSHLSLDWSRLERLPRLANGAESEELRVLVAQGEDDTRKLMTSKEASLEILFSREQKPASSFKYRCFP